MNSRIKGVVNTNIPAAKALGEEIDVTADKYGRQVIWPYQIREFQSTAYVTLTGGGETTLLAGEAGVFNDLMLITAANESGAAQTIQIRASTGGGIVGAVRVPADSTSGFSLSYPIIQNAVADTWTVQNAGTDVTNTTVKVSATFIKNRNA